MKPRELGNLSEAIRSASISDREPSSEFASWIADTGMRPDLADFFLKHAPSGVRSLGAFDFIGADPMREIDSLYSTTSIGRVVVFGKCGDGSYVGVGADTGVPCWIKKGHLEADELEEGLVEYPGSLARFLISAATDQDFPFDPFQAEELFSEEGQPQR